MSYTVTILSPATWQLRSNPFRNSFARPYRPAGHETDCLFQHHGAGSQASALEVIRHEKILLDRELTGGRTLGCLQETDEYLYVWNRVEAVARQTSSDASARHLGFNRDDKSHAVQQLQAKEIVKTQVKKHWQNGMLIPQTPRFCKQNRPQP